MRAGGSAVFGSGTLRTVSRIRGTQTASVGSNRHAPAAFSRNPPASDVASRRAARRGGVPLRRLARGRRAVVVAGSAARAAGRVRLAVPHRPLRSQARRDSSPSRTRTSRPTRSRTSSHVIRTGAPTGLASPALARSPTRSASSANGRHCARTARDRGIGVIGDVPIYVSDAGADVETWPELFAKGEVAGAPPDALSARTGSTGATRSTTGIRTA